MRKSLFFNLLLALVFGISTVYAQQDVQNAQNKSDFWLEEKSDQWGVSKAQIQERLKQEKMQEEQPATKPQKEETNRNGSTGERAADYFEDFSGDFPPAGWTIGGPGDAPEQSSTSNAGGETPEVEFYYYYSEDGDYLESESGTLPELDVLEFKSYIDAYSGSSLEFNCIVTVNGDNVTPWENPITDENVAQDTYQIDISGYSDPKVRFEITGETWSINWWNIDDVIVYTPPSITSCPSDIDANTSDDGKGDCSTAVSYTVTADGTPSPSYSYEFTGATTGSGSGTGSGSVFNIGTTNVTVTAENSYGTVTCSFTVTVTDDETPTVTAASNVTASTSDDGTGDCATDVAITDATTDDNCSVSTLAWTMSGATTGSGSGQVGTYNFAEGTTTVEYTVTDASGNTSTDQMTVIVNDDELPNVFTQNITLSLDQSGTATLTPDMIDNGTYDNCSFTRSVIPTTLGCVNIGMNSVMLVATDASGNQSFGTAMVDVVDNLAPVVNTQDITVQLNENGEASITASDIDNGTSDNCQLSDMSLDITNFNCSDVGNPVTVTLTATDAHDNSSSQTATVTVEDDIAPTVTTQNMTVELNDSGSASITANEIDNGSSDNCSIESMSLDQSSFSCADVGTNTVTLTVTDVNGNVNSAEASVTVEDNIVPTAVTKNVTAELDEAGAASITPDIVDDGSSDNCSIESMSLDISTFDCSNVGDNVVTLTVTDANGNTDTQTATVTVEDNTAPTVLTQNVTVELDDSGAASITTDDINNGSSDNCSIESMALDQTSFNCADVGTNTVTLTVTDVNGNENSAEATVTVEDDQAPVVVTQNIDLELDANGTATLTPDMVDNGTYDNCTFTTSVSRTSFNCEDVGINSVTFIATDASNNQSFGSALVNVVDNLPPVVQTQDITVELDENGEASITKSDIDNGTSDNCQLASTSLDITNFNCSDVGNPVTVTLSATDIYGNSSSQTATVTVEDNIVPTVAAQDMTVELNDSGSASITANEIDNGSSDNCSIESMALDQNSFGCSDVGANTVTLTVTDVNGNENTAEATVNVEENIEPTVVTQDVTMELDAGGQASITTDTIDDGSYDNCAVESMSLDVTSFDCSNVGENTVELTVTDVNGNTDTQDATVNVVDNIAPSVLTQDATVELDASGTATISVSDINNGSSDNCLIESMALDQTSFSCADVGTNTVTLTVTDVNSNENSAEAIVTVEENIAPTVVTQDVTMELDANGQASITTDTIDDGSYDNCSVESMSLDVTSFDCSNVGENIVELTVTDVNGNVSSQTATVTVMDNINPVAETKPVTLYLGPDGQAILQPSEIDDGSYDNCSINDMSVDSEPYGCGDLGEHTVTLTVTDPSGNTSSETNTVTVADTISPNSLEVTTTDLQCYQDASGQIEITTQGGWGTVAYSINGGESWQQDDGLFTNLSVGNYNVVIEAQHGCQTVYEDNPVTLTQPEEIIISDVMTTPISCYGAADGMIEVAAEGGTGSLMYSIDGGVTWQEESTFSDLAPGTF